MPKKRRREKKFEPPPLRPGDFLEPSPRRRMRVSRHRMKNAMEIIARAYTE